MPRGAPWPLPDADLLIVDDASPDGTADVAEELERRARPDRGHAPVGQDRARRRVPGRVARGDRRRRRDLRADGRRPVARSGRAAGARSRSSSTAPTWRSAADTCRAGSPRTGRDAGACCRGGGIATRPACSGLAVNDATAGYRAYRTDALERMEFDTVTAEGYGFQMEMTYRLVRIGGKVVEFPITFRDRTAGRVEDVGWHRPRGARCSSSSCGSPTSVAVAGDGRRGG